MASTSSITPNGPQDGDGDEARAAQGKEDQDERKTSFNKKKGGIVHVETTQPVPMEAFEIAESAKTRQTVQPPDHGARSSAFNWRRSGRASIALSLGVGARLRQLAGRPTLGEDTDVFDPYSKASDKICMMIYLGTIIGTGRSGRGIFGVSSVLAKGGWIPGLLSICLMTGIHWFLCVRMVEMPTLLAQNVESYPGIAKALLNSGFARVFALMSICCWFGTAALDVDALITNMAALPSESPVKASLANPCLSRGSWWLGLLIGCGLIPLAVSTGAKNVRKSADIAVKSITAAVALAILVSLIGAATSRPGTRVQPVVFGKLSDIPSAVHDLLDSFCGIGMLPYIIGEMLNPDKARTICTQVSAIMLVFYLLVAAIPYACWGGLLAHVNLLVIMGNASTLCAWGTSAVRLCCVVKTAATFPIIIWPLVRELEALLAWEGAPSVVLQLPWAIRWQQRKKIVSRVALVALTVVPTFLNQCIHSVFREIIMAIPVCFIQIAAPATLPVLAILWHQRQQSVSQDLEKQARSTHGAPEYFLKSFKAHLVMTMVVAAISVATCICFIIACGQSSAADIEALVNASLTNTE